MRIPFPLIDSGLAVIPHMYVCLNKSGDTKNFVKCQSLKPRHLGKNKEPFRRIEEDPDSTRNPFKQKTLIDCDKKFLIESTEISKDLLTSSRRDVCQSLFDKIKSETSHASLATHRIDSVSLAYLNSKIKAKS